MRHRRRNKRLGRSGAHRRALVSSLVCSLIRYKRIRTTLAKAKAARQAAEQMVTVGREGTLAARRRVAAELRQPWAVKALFDEIVPKHADRNGGYTRILKLGPGRSDGAEMALLEWVGITAPLREKKKEKKEAKGKEPEGKKEEKKA